MKCLDEILLEWSVRSPDGLATGIYSKENVNIFREILKEKNLTESVVEEVISEILSLEAQPRVKKAVAPAPEEDLTNKTIWELMVLKKRMNPTGVEILHKAVEDYDQDKSFVALYDTCLNVEDAVKIYVDNKYSAIVNAANKFEYKGLGRGELIFVYLLKGCRSGGTSDSDLVMEDGRKIDVKESTADMVKLSIASVKGLSDLGFYKGIIQLTTFIRKHKPDAGNFLKHVLADETEYKSSRPAGPAEITKFGEFMDHLNTAEMNGSVFTALELVSYKLDSSAVPTSGTVDVKIDDEEKTLVVNNPEEVEQAIAQPKRQHVNMDVSPIVDKVKEFLIPEIKNLSYIKKKYNRDMITEEITPHLHFKDGIVVVNSKKGTNGATYIAGDEFNKKLKFVNLTFGALKMRII